MTVLTTAARKALGKGAFAIVKKVKGKVVKKYPIYDKAHALAALRYGARYATPSEFATIKREVAKRFPDLKKTVGKAKKTMSKATAVKKAKVTAKKAARTRKARAGR